MSAGKTDSRSGSGSAQGSASNPETKKNKERPPFKLCFVKQQESGRSNVSICKTTANVLTPKFYSRDAEQCNVSELEQTVAKISEEEQRMPKKIYQWPLLTSHTVVTRILYRRGCVKVSAAISTGNGSLQLSQNYGWWHDRGIQPTDSRLNFHKKTSDMVSYQMRIYADDRKLKGLGH